MIVTLKSTADATLYEAYPTVNTGLDEILEFGKLRSSSAALPTGEVVSILKFDTSGHTTWPVTASVFLNLKIANATELSRNQTILVYPYTGSWEEGSGYFLQQPYNVQNGIVWNNISASFRQPTPVSTTINTFPLQDISIDVSSFRSLITSQSLTGFVIALPSQDIASGSANIKVFSSQTHTVYEPTLTVKWDDQVFTTGSLKTLPVGEVEIAFRNIKQHYVYGSKQLVNLVVRDKYPLHGFNATARYDTKYFLPRTTYFRIRDVAADTLINDFSDGEKISCANNSNYFMLDTTPLYKGRYYKVEFKIVKPNGEVLLLSPPETFIVR
jgi:hypothetical protein